MSIKALIFDVDGTIADTEETHRQAFNAAFLEHGLAWDWSRRDYAELLCTSGGKERLVAYIESLRLEPQEQTRLKRTVQLIHDSKTRICAELIADGRAPLRPGVDLLLASLGDADAPLAGDDARLAGGPTLTLQKLQQLHAAALLPAGPG